MGEPLKSLSVKGFRSIAALEDFKLNRLNILIGANGSGKSNFIGLFDFLGELIRKNLGLATADAGGAETFLHLGSRVTPELEVSLRFGQNGYDFRLKPNVEDRFYFSYEAALYDGPYGKSKSEWRAGGSEARLPDLRDARGTWGANYGVPHYVHDAISSWTVYHFHDTSSHSPARRPGAINDNERLRHDASNLAAVLYRMQETRSPELARIRDAVRLAAPFFHDFKLRPNPLSPEIIQLEWLQQGSDYPFRASQLSDGTLRFICLCTALLQPALPATLLFDEPELGLHPSALSVLAALFKSAAAGSWRQLVATTQSPAFLAEFGPEDVVVVERANGASVLRRLNPDVLADWLQEYSLGDLWLKNLLGGRPGPETVLTPAVASERAE